MAYFGSENFDALEILLGGNVNDVRRIFLLEHSVYFKQEKNDCQTVCKSDLRDWPKEGGRLPPSETLEYLESALRIRYACGEDASLGHLSALEDSDNVQVLRRKHAVYSVCMEIMEDKKDEAKRWICDVEGGRAIIVAGYENNEPTCVSRYSFKTQSWTDVNTLVGRTSREEWTATLNDYKIVIDEWMKGRSWIRGTGSGVGKWSEKGSLWNEMKLAYL